MANKTIKYTLLSVFMLLLFPIIGSAQDIEPDSVEFKATFDIYDRLVQTGYNGSKIVINQDSQVESTLKQHFNKGGSKKSLKGWRVRIFRDNAREARDRSTYIVSSFKNNYPGIPVYRTYAAPTWYISVGDFRTRDEAEKMKKEIKNVYSGASLIEESINFPPL